MVQLYFWEHRSNASLTKFIIFTENLLGKSGYFFSSESHKV